MSEVTLRALRAGDAAQVGRVAYLTGFFGSSAARYFPDPQLFADIWTGPYFESGGRLGFVAERGGEVVGYILGLPSQGEYGRALTRVIAGRIVPGVLLGRYRRPFGGLPYLLRFARFPGQHAPFDRYPAHLHINLLPGTRGLGLGSALLTAYLNALRARGVPGVQLSTTRENEAALGLYGRAGFSVYAEEQLPLWTPWLGRETVHVVMVKDL